jgi:hypothetical protein
MASKSKSKGSSKKAPPVAELRKVVAQTPKPKAALAAKALPKPVAKNAPKKPAPKLSKTEKPASKPAATPTKTAPKNVQKSSSPAKSATKALKKGKSIQSTKALKSIPAKVPAKKAAPKPTPKASSKAKPAVPTKQASAKVQPVQAKDAKKAIPPKSPAPAAKKAAPVAKPSAKTPAKSAPSPLPAIQDKSKKAASGPKADSPVEKESRKAKLDLFKGPFFQEVPVGSAAVRKSRVPQAPVVTLRKPKGEESHDELIARIEKELLAVRMAGKKVHREQVCTKCCINPVDPSFMVDRDTGYCTECALVLGLGHTREARQQNFHPSLMKSEDEVVPE